jgi:hypothetical protein
MDGFRKSSYSDANGGQCVEAASASGTVLIRDTADRALTLGVSSAAWARFTQSLKKLVRASAARS